MELSGKACVITGGGSGIGKATALLCAKEGASVLVVDIDGKAARKTSQEITATGGKARALRADVARSSDARRIAKTAVVAFGRLDVLANIAGIQGAAADVVEMSEADWDRVIAVNLTSVFLVSKFCIPEMVKHGGGSIINVASIQSYANLLKSSAYAATKGAVVSFTRAMALDFAGRKVRVNAVAPGYVETPLLQKAARDFGGDPEQTYRRWRSRVPLKRLIQPSEVAQVIVFLASDRSSVVTGSTYLVDGGILTAQAGWTD